jgi:hypothetical protein
MQCGDPGTPWVTGAFTPNCEAELVRMGVMVPTETPGMFTTAHVDVDSLPVRPARRSR